MLAPTRIKFGYGSFYLSYVFKWLSEEFEIEDEPAADVAQVVRCKDCIYNIDGMCFHARPLKPLLLSSQIIFAVGARPNERAAV